MYVLLKFKACGEEDKLPKQSGVSAVGVSAQEHRVQFQKAAMLLLVDSACHSGFHSCFLSSAYGLCLSTLLTDKPSFDPFLQVDFLSFLLFYQYLMRQL